TARGPPSFPSQSVSAYASETNVDSSNPKSVCFVEVIVPPLSTGRIALCVSKSDTTSGLLQNREFTYGYRCGIHQINKQKCQIFGIHLRRDGRWHEQPSSRRRAPARGCSTAEESDPASISRHTV